MPSISAHLKKVATKHGDRFPYMKKVHDLFTILVKELSLHMEEEEKVVFPRLREVDNLFRAGKSPETLKQIDRFINVMEADHSEAGYIMFRIRRLTNNYSVPPDACTTFKITLAELKEFEEDLHKHVHIENNILFPKAYNRITK
jgi:regulator of cell morphogenesis and NO signaling